MIHASGWHLGFGTHAGTAGGPLSRPGFRGYDDLTPRNPGQINATNIPGAIQVPLQAAGLRCLRSGRAD